MTVSSSTARLLGLLVVLGLSVGTTGCSSTSSPVRVQYQSSADETTYRTRRMQLEGIRFSSGYNRSPRFFLTVRGTCEGKNCSPNAYDLRFSVEYEEPVYLTAESVSLSFGEQTETWRNPFPVQRGSQLQALGSIFTVRLPAEKLSTIGEVDEVDGTLGTLEFDLPYSSRAPIRALFASPDEDGAS
jgi:hypothetical protein